MNVFLDTSSLFKLYVQENGSDDLYELFELQPIEGVYLSEFTLIEFRSIVWRKVRMNEITGANAHLLLDAFDKDHDTYSFITTTKFLLQLAGQLLDKYGTKGLRSLDSIQLASPVSIRDDVQLFKTADTLLNDFFIAESLPITVA